MLPDQRRQPRRYRKAPQRLRLYAHAAHTAFSRSSSNDEGAAAVFSNIFAIILSPMKKMRVRSRRAVFTSEAEADAPVIRAQSADEYSLYNGYSRS